MPEKITFKHKPVFYREWHPIKNGNLKPRDFSPGSNKKVWWKCGKGHEWETSLSNRSRGDGCPYCSHHRVTKETCLATINPKLSRQWHTVKNKNLTAFDVLPNSNKKVWWICKKGHEWEARIIKRNAGSGCPYCSNKKVCVNNSLMTVNPNLASEWHSIKNGALTPEDVAPFSNKKVWWLCIKGHAWEAAVSNRSTGRGCPFCAGRKTDRANCLVTVNRKLSNEWHPVKNKLITPRDVTAASSKKIWWICKNGHEWQAAVFSRNKGAGCPFCHNLRVNKDNCLLNVNRKLAREWHPVKNGTLTPRDVVCGSARKVWWKCRKGHEWKTTVLSRNQGSRCPYCINQMVCEDNCLMTLNRNLAMEWHPTKNGKLTPWDVVPGSHQKVWWVCMHGHDWKAPINSRSNAPIKLRKGTGCPYCAHQKVCKDNCLMTQNRNLAMEWHPTKNGKLTPWDVVPGSSRKVWWLCMYGHYWQARINSRSSAYIKLRKGTGCPYCARVKKWRGELEKKSLKHQFSSSRAKVKFTP